MKRTAMIVLAGLLMAVGSASGETRAKFRFGLLAGIHSGETKYELDISPLGSELVFPLDQKMAGIELGFSLFENSRENWLGRVRLQTALSDPGGKFTDIDWVDAGHGTGFVFSGTESNVEGSLVDLEFELGRMLKNGCESDLFLVVGVGYQKIKQRAIDIVGTKLVVFGGDVIPSYVTDDDLVLTYEIRYIRPQIGLMPRFRLSRALRAEVKAVVSSLLHAKDIDDHVLRFFQVRSDGKGFGYAGRVALAYSKTGPSRRGFFAQIVAEYQYGSIKMNGYRRYYGNNPSDGYSIGEGFPVQTTVSNTQYNLRLHIGMGF